MKKQEKPTGAGAAARRGVAVKALSAPAAASSRKGGSTSRPGGRNPRPMESASGPGRGASGGSGRAPARKDAGRSARTTSERKIAIALAGGGPIGAMYEIGAVTALAEALEGVDFNDLYAYVGVSSGGFLAAGLANGLTPGRMARLFIESEGADDEPFHPEILLRPAFREYLQRAASIPPLLLASIWHYVSHPLDQHFVESFQRLSRAVPTGMFNNEGINDFLTRLFSVAGRTNDFRELKRKLFLVATDLDSGKSVAFGGPGFDQVPISTAVQASAALPGLFPPVLVDGRYYVDGALKKTLHASVALRYGAKLVLCINPLVPFDSQLAADHGHPARHRLVEGGLPLVLSQTFRAIIHSRMQVGMGKYATEFKDADVILFEPNRDDADMFFTNVFSYASRRRLSEHAYHKTRAELLRRSDELAPVLARHGIRIRFDVLRDEGRRLIGTRAKARRKSTAIDAVAQLGRCLETLQGWVSGRAAPARRVA